MRSKVTVVLLFLNVVLFAYIYYNEGPKVPNTSQSVFGPEISTIDSLTRVTRNGQTVRLERNKDPRRGDAWLMTQPFEWPASPNAVQKLLNGLRLLKHETSFSVDDLVKSAQTLGDFGLDQPAITLTFTSAGKTYTAKIGDATQVGNRLYLLGTDGRTIHVVSRALADSIGQPAADLRAESIFAVPVFEVRSLNVQSSTPNVKVRLRRDSSSHWNYESPIQARADKANVEITINALNSLAAKNFLEAREIDLERAGLNSPSLQVTLEGNARRETLLLGSVVPPPASPAGAAAANPPPGAAAAAAAPPDDPAALPSTEFYAKMEDKPVIFTVPVPNHLLVVLRTAQETLRDLHVLDFEPATVTSVTLAAPGQPELTLQRLEAGTGDQGWQEVTRIPGQTPLTSTADPAIVGELLLKLRGLSVEKFLSDAPSASDLENYGFNRPERVITLNLNTGGGPQGTEPLSVTLQIGVAPDKAGVAYARTTSTPFVYQVLPDILNSTPAIPRVYRLRLLRELPESARIVGLHLIELASNTPVYAKDLADSEKNWGPTLNAETERRRKALTNLLVQIRTLRARGFTAETFTPDHADTGQGSYPWKYRLDYTVAFAGGTGAAQSTASSLFLTDRIGGITMLAGTSDFGGVNFAVTQEMLDAIFALTYGEKNDPGPPEKIPAGAALSTPPTPSASPPPAPASNPASTPAQPPAPTPAVPTGTGAPTAAPATAAPASVPPTTGASPASTPAAEPEPKKAD